MGRLYTDCPMCDYKGNVRIEESVIIAGKLQGTPTKQVCPVCKGTKFAPINGITSEQLEMLVGSYNHMKNQLEAALSSRVQLMDVIERQGMALSARVEQEAADYAI